MPIYEYQCNSCHHHVDIMQKVSDSPITRCPECGKETLTKLVSAAGFQLKGTGWYVTDFKNKSTTSDKGGDSGSKSSDSGSNTGGGA